MTNEKTQGHPRSIAAKALFSREDIGKLWANGSEEAHIVLALIYTGIRANELFSLTPADVHTDGDRAYIIVSGIKEGGRRRMVALNHRVAPFFSAWKDRGGAYLITDANGGQINVTDFRTRTYDPLLDRLGIEHVNLHGARNTFAAMVEAAGGDKTVLSKYMGVEAYKTNADLYLYPGYESLRRIAEAVN